MARQKTRRLDPRWFQIASLTGLLIYGIAVLSFDVTPGRIALLVAVAEFCEWASARVRGIAFDPRSPLISSLSLCLLARTATLPFLAATAAVAIGSKFVLRARGKHVFNPTNLALVVLLAGSDRAWVSPGQWGGPALAGFGLSSRLRDTMAATIGNMAIHAALPVGTGNLGRVAYLNRVVGLEIPRTTAAVIIILWFKLLAMATMARAIS